MPHTVATGRPSASAVSSSWSFLTASFQLAEVLSSSCNRSLRGFICLVFTLPPPVKLYDFCTISVRFVRFDVYDLYGL